MSRSIITAILFFALGGALPASAETATVGKAAPDFTLQDSDGKQHSLKDYKGKVVVLEWFNPECPFVKKHYGSGNMQKAQSTVTSEGGTWLTIASSAPGKQGHLTKEQAKDTANKLGLKSTLLLDGDGVAATAYHARVTPHMFVVGPDGILAYDGAIDDKPTPDVADIPSAKNYVLSAVAAVKEGKPVTPSSTEPYGCSVKYK